MSEHLKNMLVGLVTIALLLAFVGGVFLLGERYGDYALPAAATIIAVTICWHVGRAVRIAWRQAGNERG